MIKAEKGELTMQGGLREVVMDWLCISSMLHRVPWQDPAMACDACSLAGRKLCVVCKFRSATMQELWESYGRVYARKDEEQL